MGCSEGHLLPPPSVWEPFDFPPRCGPYGMAEARQQTGMGGLGHPSCYPSNGQQTPPGAQPPWTADTIPHPWLWRLPPQGNFKRQGKQRGPHQIPVPKSPLQGAGQAGPARTIGAAIAMLLFVIAAARQIPQLRSRAITPQAFCRQNIYLATYMIRNVKRLSDSSLRTAALAISSVKYFQNPKVLREKSSYFD